MTKEVMKQALDALINYAEANMLIDMVEAAHDIKEKNT